MVCAVSGERADGTCTETFRSPVGGQYWLLLLGIVPFLVVRYVTRGEAKGKVPVARVAFASLERQARERRWRAAGLILGGMVIGLASGPIGAGVSDALGWAIALVGLGLFLAGVVYDSRTPLLRGHVEPSGRWVVFENAHPAFAAAVDAQVRSA
jgi:hypothetical protein